MEDRLRAQDIPKPGRTSDSDSRELEPDDPRHEFETNEDILADSLENCCISPSRDEELPDGSSEKNSSDGVLPDVKNGANGTDNHLQSTFHNTRTMEDDDDTHSVADSFSDYQSADRDIPSDFRHSFGSDSDGFGPDRLKSCGSGEARSPFMDERQRNYENSEGNHVPTPQSRTSNQTQSPPSRSLSSHQSSSVQNRSLTSYLSPQKSNALFTAPRNLADLLSWEFDDQGDSREDDPSLNSSPAILTPTVLQ